MVSVYPIFFTLVHCRQAFRFTFFPAGRNCLCFFVVEKGFSCVVTDYDTGLRVIGDLAVGPVVFAQLFSTLDRP